MIIRRSSFQKECPFVVDKDKPSDRRSFIGLRWCDRPTICVQPMAYISKFGNGVNFQQRVMKLADGKPFGEARYDPSKPVQGPVRS